MRKIHFKDLSDAPPPVPFNLRNILTGQTGPNVNVSVDIPKESAATLYKTAGIFAAGFIIGAVINNLQR